MKTAFRSLVIVFAMVIQSSAAYAQQLGGGESPDISIWRILLALLFSLFIGGIVIGFLYMRNMAGSRSTGRSEWLSRISFRTEERTGRDIEILDMRKLNPQSDACLLQCRNVEYLLLLNSAGVTILSKQPTRGCDAIPTEDG